MRIVVYLHVFFMCLPYSLVFFVSPICSVHTQIRSGWPLRLQAIFYTYNLFVELL